MLTAANAIHHEIIGARSVSELIRREDIVVTNGNIVAVGENMNVALNAAAYYQITEDVEQMRRQVLEELRRP